MVSEAVRRPQGAWGDRFLPSRSQSASGTIGRQTLRTGVAPDRERTFPTWTYFSPILLSSTLRRMGERYVHATKVRSRWGAHSDRRTPTGELRTPARPTRGAPHPCWNHSSEGAAVESRQQVRQESCWGCLRARHGGCGWGRTARAPSVCGWRSGLLPSGRLLPRATGAHSFRPRPNRPLTSVRRRRCCAAGGSPGGVWRASLASRSSRPASSLRASDPHGLVDYDRRAHDWTRGPGALGVGRGFGRRRRMTGAR